MTFHINGLISSLDFEGNDVEDNANPENHAMSVRVKAFHQDFHNDPSA